MKKRGQFPLPQELTESPRKQNAKKKALKTSIAEGSAAAASFGAGNSFITPFALAIGANPLQIGFLSSFSGLLNPIAQFFGARSMEKNSRKTLVLRFVFLQALMWIPMAILGLLYWKGIFQTHAVYALIGIYLLIVIFGGFAGPAWFSWMGDIVPPKEKGRYFAKRNRATGVTGLAVALIAAFLLDALRTKGLALLGFTILFSLAFTFRFISFIFFNKQYNPKFKLEKGYYFSIWAFLKKYDNFGKFAVYRAVFNFSLMIASPFFAVYMLQELQFSYVTFITVSASASVFYLLFTPLIGKFSDRYGNVKLFYLSNILFGITPILWIFMKSPIVLIFIPQLISGLANAAFMIPTTNFIYDAASPQHRSLCSTYKNILVGVGIFAGSLLGGFLANRTLIPSVNPFFLVFGLSAALRILSGAFFLPQLKEERRVKRLPPMEVNLAHPFKSLSSEVGWFKNILFR